MDDLFFISDYLNILYSLKLIFFVSVTGYKTHTDCIVGNSDLRDRMGTILVYLDDVPLGGETSFPGKHLQIQIQNVKHLIAVIICTYKQVSLLLMAQ